MKNKENEELESRRQFFRQTVKRTLPILGAILLSNSQLIGAIHKIEPNKKEKPTDCESGCVFSCSGSCTNTCLESCILGCKDSCSSMCRDSCNGSCKDTCSGACKEDCMSTCKYTCSNSCSSSNYYN